ncbi:MAG: hypothetical protein AB2A00_40605 [Myxococcota bacterium]
MWTRSGPAALLLTTGCNCNPGFGAFAGHCAVFGGALATNGDLCPQPACRTENPATEECGCPPGFILSGRMNLLDTSSCPGNNPPYGWEAMYFCHVPSLPAGAEFGGVYERDENDACAVANSFTGGCGCPAGFNAVEMPVAGSCWYWRKVGVCYNAAATRTTFHGTYLQSDYSGYGSGGCVTGNPLNGGACACPPDTRDIPIRSVLGPDNSCNSNGQYGAFVHVCMGY